MHPNLACRPHKDPLGNAKRHGILSYTNECNYMKVPGDNSNAANAPDLIDVDAGNPGARGFSPAEQSANLPTRERSHTVPYLPTQGLIPPPYSGYRAAPEMDASSANNDMSGTSPDGPSNRPTPNSSTAASDQPRPNLTPNVRPINGSGGNSFEASPAVSHQNLNMSAATPGAGEVDRNVNAFFGTPSSFGIPAAGVSAGLATPDQRFGIADAPGGGPGPGGPGPGPSPGDFSVSPGWPEIPPQPGMTPVAEGLFRSMMGMGPMETMEMGWEPNP